jgi:hypothetical protein
LTDTPIPGSFTTTSRPNEIASSGPAKLVIAASPRRDSTCSAAKPTAPYIT